MIAALLALLLSFAAHLAPAPATEAPAAPAAPVWVRCPSYPAADPPAGCQGPTEPWSSAPSWDDRTTPPADLGEGAPAADVPMCVPDLGILVDCWTP